MKYGLTKKEEQLYARALFFQRKADECICKFKDSLLNRFSNSTVINEFEEYDLWTLNPSGDLSEDKDTLEEFWSDVRREQER